MAHEFVHFISLRDPQPCQLSEVVQNFLYREVLDEPYYLPMGGGPCSLFGVVDAGVLVGAASVGSSIEKGQLEINLLGVAANRRGQGIGSELLRYVEEYAARVGATALAVYPMQDTNPDPRTHPIRFFKNRGYTDHSDPTTGLLVKNLQ